MNQDSSRKWWILSVTSLGALLSSLNFSTLIIALPELIRGLKASVFQAMWIMLAYMVAQTVVVLLAGSIADRIGRKRLYLIGIIMFTIVSFISGFAGDATMLIFWRILQGGSGAVLIAISTAIVADAFPKQELGKALGINITVVAIGQIVGPVLGGWLTTAYGWEWTFWFNVPFGVIAVLWGLWTMGFKREKSADAAKKFDLGGLITYTLSVTGLLLTLTWGPLQSWSSPVVWVSALLFVVCFPIFIRIEMRHPAALLHLPLLLNRTFSMGVYSGALNSLARMAIMFMLIFYYQGVMSFDALKAGILLIPLAIGMLVFAPISGWIGDRFGEVLPATLGLLVSMAGIVGLTMNAEADSSYVLQAVWMVVISIGSGLFNSPNTGSVMNSAGPLRRGEASGIMSLLQNIGMIFSIALVMPIITSNIPKDAMMAIFSGTMVGLDGANASMNGFIHGLHIVFYSMGVLLLFAAVLSYLRKSKKAAAAAGHLSDIGRATVEK
ncbi:MFS transporter [Paenibacillus humicola]|uniref:MFS transporter n=1 Tax=Paenibacillus humicola TaxID=3110540 RepID=UPI00237BCCCA|nr:MFS transporter [Paenibacillus humicola]